MKLYNINKVLFLSFICGMVCSCSEKFLDDETSNEDWSDQTPITLSLKNLYVILTDETRGTGAFDQSLATTDASYRNKVNNTFFNVYAFRSTQNVDMTQTTQLDDAKANCLIDNPNDFYCGKPAKLDGNESAYLSFLKDTASNEFNQLFFGRTAENGYNFYVYSIDDLPQNATTVHRTGSSISVDVEIDGSQDVMCGISPNLTLAYLSNYYPNLSSTEMNTIINNGGGFSAYSIHHSVTPFVEMEHCFTRLCFNAYPADTDASRITIDAVTVKAPNQGVLTVASTTRKNVGYTSKGQSVDMYLHEKYNGGKTTAKMNPVRMPAYVEGTDVWNQTHVQLGESLLLPPAVSYPMTVYFSEYYTNTDGTVEVRHFTSDYTLKLNAYSSSSVNAFQAGNAYTINIAVYSSANARPQVNIQDWNWQEESLELELNKKK